MGTPIQRRASKGRREPPRGRKLWCSQYARRALSVGNILIDEHSFSSKDRNAHPVRAFASSRSSLLGKPHGFAPVQCTGHQGKRQSAERQETAGPIRDNKTEARADHPATYQAPMAFPRLKSPMFTAAARVGAPAAAALSRTSFWIATRWRSQNPPSAKCTRRTSTGYQSANAGYRPAALPLGTVRPAGHGGLPSG
ncbi:hypothetical protein D3C76_1306780 [compost metagenome]